MQCVFNPDAHALGTPLLNFVEKATLPKLVEKATPPSSSPDVEEVASLVMMLDSFTNSLSFMKLLVSRWTSAEKFVVSPLEKRYIQANILYVLSVWFGKYLYNEEWKDSTQFQELFEKIRPVFKPYLTLTASHFNSQFLDSLYNAPGTLFQNRERGSSWFANFQQTGREVKETYTIRNFDPVDLANQWTLIEFNAVRSINPREYLNQVTLWS